MAEKENLLVKTNDFIRYFLPKIEKMPRNYKFIKQPPAGSEPAGGLILSQPRIQCIPQAFSHQIIPQYRNKNG